MSRWKYATEFKNDEWTFTSASSEATGGDGENALALSGGIRLGTAWATSAGTVHYFNMTRVGSEYLSALAVVGSGIAAADVTSFRYYQGHQSSGTATGTLIASFEKCSPADVWIALPAAHAGPETASIRIALSASAAISIPYIALVGPAELLDGPVDVPPRYWPDLKNNDQSWGGPGGRKWNREHTPQWVQHVRAIANISSTLALRDAFTTARGKAPILQCCDTDDPTKDGATIFGYQDGAYPSVEAVGPGNPMCRVETTLTECLP